MVLQEWGHPLTGGVIIEVSSPDQAKIAESSGAAGVSITEILPNGTRGTRMPDGRLVHDIAVSIKIPVVAKCRVGHFVEAQILDAMKIVPYIDENELLPVADRENYVNKDEFPGVHFMCGARDLWDVLRRVHEGAALIRTQGDQAGTGHVAETVGNVRKVMDGIRMLGKTEECNLIVYARKFGVPLDVVIRAKKMGRLPAVQFAAGGIATPADAAMMMQLGCDGVIVGVEVFDGQDAETRVRRIVEAVKNFRDAEKMAGEGLE